MKKLKYLSSSEIAEIQTIVGSLFGTTAWGVSLGIGSFVTLNFGPMLEIDTISKILQGEWHLWIQQCVWRVEKNNSVLAGSEDSRPLLKKAIKIFDGLSIQSININAYTFETAFIFEKNICLKTFPISYWSDDEYWWLFTPIRKVFIAGPGINWTYQSADENS